MFRLTCCRRRSGISSPLSGGCWPRSTVPVYHRSWQNYNKNLKTRPARRRRLRLWREQRRQPTNQHATGTTRTSQDCGGPGARRGQAPKRRRNQGWSCLSCGACCTPASSPSSCRSLRNSDQRTRQTSISCCGRREERSPQFNRTQAGYSPERDCVSNNKNKIILGVARFFCDTTPLTFFIFCLPSLPSQISVRYQLYII